MKYTKRTWTSLALAIALIFSSCEDLSEVNINPNSAEKVSSNYILTYVITKTAQAYHSLGQEGSRISGAMQYIQVGTNENAAVVNHYGWTHENWATYYDILRNNKIIYENAVADDNNFFEATSLIMKSFVYGLLTDLYGDVPFSEALEAKNSTFFPKYDQQIDIYKGIFEDLRVADDLLQNLDNSKDQINPASDVLYGGDATKWRRFANALRMRYSLRVESKSDELKGLGIDIGEEFKEAKEFTFTGISDEAKLAYLGSNSDNSFSGGPLNSSNPRFFLKPAKTIVDKLVSIKDPRLDRWVRPVGKKWDASVDSATELTVTNGYGESYPVTLMPLEGNTDIDTALYVGLPIGLPVVEAMAYNKGNDTEIYHPERSPYISFIHDRYRKNSDEYVQMNLMDYSEMEFILAEAIQSNSWGLTGNAEEHYKKGILSSMEKYGVKGFEGFNFDTYYEQYSVDYQQAVNPQERILEQKWISSWLGIQSWFDWRRTGFPALVAGEVTHSGAAIPIRYMYPTPNLDPNYIGNYNQAIERLEPTPFVSSGQSKDHPYSKMWLLQGTSHPW